MSAAVRQNPVVRNVWPVHEWENIGHIHSPLVEQKDKTKCG